MKKLEVEINLDGWGGFHPAATSIVEASNDPQEALQIAIDIIAEYCYLNIPDPKATQMASIDALRSGIGSMVEGSLEAITAWEP